MVVSIGTYYLADGTIEGGFSLTDFRIRMQRIADVVQTVPQQLVQVDLAVGMLYEIVQYNSPDDFTNIGGTNVTGNRFIATGPVPASWAAESILQALSPAILNRNKKRADISFSISRVHDSIKDAEEYILDHEFTVPRTGDVKLIVGFNAISIGTPEALIINGAIISHELTRQIGKYTEHAYTIIGAPFFAPTPGVDCMLLETGDFILLETGDKILLEV